MSRIRKSFYTSNQLKYEILNIENKQQYLYMPNEVFEDLVEEFKEVKGVTSTHIAYAYSYLYLINYMWRYAKYYTTYISDGTGYEPINEKMIKRILGFAKGEQYTYITKNNGLLFNMGYIKKVTDKPCRYFYVEEAELPPDIRDRLGVPKKEVLLKDTVFIMESEYPEIYGNKKNWKVSMPVKAITRFEEGELDGTFHNVQNTHMIPVNVFIYCMTDPELGVEGFYLYCFLKHKCDLFGSFNCSSKRMTEMTGIALTQLKETLVKLEQRNMIDNDHKPFCVNKPEGKVARANAYTAKEYRYFFKNKDQWKQIPKRRVMNVEQYEKEVGFVECIAEVNVCLPSNM